MGVASSLLRARCDGHGLHVRNDNDTLVICASGEVQLVHISETQAVRAVHEFATALKERRSGKS